MNDEIFDENDEPSADEPMEDFTVSDFLKDALRNQRNQPRATDKIDYSQFREESKDDWETVAGEGNLPQQLASLIRKSILLPRQNFQIPIATAYLMLPSALCSRVPILFSQGPSGCGKSTLGFLACELHNQQPIGAGSTFASIRNVIASSRRWQNDLPVEYPGNEKHTCLVWEDIQPSDMLAGDGNIFSLLKNGVERKGTITIAQLNGTNMLFKIFSPKLISSIHPLYAKHEFRELVRRLIIIQHKPVDMWLSEDFCDETRSFNANELIDLGDVDFDGINEAFRAYWEDEGRLKLWANTAKSLARMKSHGIPDALWKISKDLICCGLVCQVWLSVTDAVEHMRRYYEWHRDNIESQATATAKALKRFVDERTALQREQNAKLVGTTLEWAIKPLEVDAKELKTYVEALANNGELDVTPSIREINSAMNSLGWELKPNSQQRNTWQPVSS